MDNGVDKAMTEVFGLRGQLAFFYVKDLRIEHFRCLDLAQAQFFIHVCTFEDLIIDNVIIYGRKMVSSSEIKIILNICFEAY